MHFGTLIFDYPSHQLQVWIRQWLWL